MWARICNSESKIVRVSVHAVHVIAITLALSKTKSVMIYGT